MKLQDYRDFCNTQLNCKTCPFNQYAYENCFGFITNEPEKADNILENTKNDYIYLVIDKFADGEQSVLGIAATLKDAQRMVKALECNYFAACLAVDPKDSGIDWKKMSEEQKNEFYKTQMEAIFTIVRKQIGKYTTEDGEKTI